MTTHPVPSVRLRRGLGRLAASMLLVAGCSTTTSSPGATTATTPPPTVVPAETSPATAASPAASPAATPAASAVAAATPAGPGTTLVHAPYGPCPSGDSPDGCLVPGTYRLGSDVLSTVVSPVVVPPGWFEWDMGPGTEGLLVDRADANGGSGWGVVFSSVGQVSRDPCDPAKGTFPAGSASSVDRLIAAMASWPGFQVGAPKPVTVGGASGRQVAVTSTKTAAECPDAVIWQTPQGTHFNGYPMVATRAKQYAAQFLLLDVAGDVLAIRTTDFPDPSPTEISNGVAPDPARHRADQATLHQILESLRLGPAPAP